MVKQPETSSTRLPLHVEISEMLAREIQAGILLDGSRLAPERVMAEELGVAVGTLRKALSDLTEKGLIERIHGSGNYVRSNGSSNSETSGPIYGFLRLELVKGGGLPTAEVLSVDKVKKTSDLGNVGDSIYGYRIRRLRRLNGVSAAIEEIWIDASKKVTLTKDELSDSLYLFYKENFGTWITRAEDNVSVLHLPSWKPEGFGSPKEKTNNIWGYIERHSFDQTNSCVEFSKTWFDPMTTRFVARWK